MKTKSQRKNKVSILIVATGSYIKYLDKLLESCFKYLLLDCEVTYHVFTDARRRSKGTTVKYHDIIHKPFPYPTLYRYHFIKAFQHYLNTEDYYIYLDVDTLITAPITSEILSPITATQHCGFVGERGSYDNNIHSTSYVGPEEGDIYYGGAFWCFNFREFWKFIYTATYMIDVDADNKIIPMWHDESVLNRYLIDNPPTRVLNPSYHYPEDIDYYKKKWKKLGLDFECKILLLDKNKENDNI